MVALPTNHRSPHGVIVSYNINYISLTFENIYIYIVYVYVYNYIIYIFV